MATPLQNSPFDDAAFPITASARGAPSCNHNGEDISLHHDQAAGNNATYLWPIGLGTVRWNTAEADVDRVFPDAQQPQAAPQWNSNMDNANVRPPIVISDVDKSQLSKIARSAANRLPDIADELMIELERAEVCESGRVPLGVVRMYSWVRFTIDRGSEHAVTLVYPEDADIIRDRLSILSPIGTALIGLSEGQVMHWTDRNGQSRWLKVLEVDNQPRD